MKPEQAGRWLTERVRTIARHPMVAILLLALAVRVAAALLIDVAPRSDAAEYAALAYSIESGKGYELGGAPTAYRAPGYPVLVAGIFYLWGDSLTGVRLAQALLDSITCLLVFLLGRNLENDRRGVRAALVYAVFPLQILYVSSLMTESLFTMLLMGTLALLSSSRISRPYVFLAGILGGCAVLVKPVALILPFAALLAPSIIGLRMQERLTMVALFCIGLLLVVTPWLLRNQSEFGRVALTSNTGVNFWIGNHEGANGSYSSPPENPLEEVHGEFRRSDTGFRLGLSYWAEKPLEALLTLPKKHAHLFGIDYWILLSSNPDSQRDADRSAHAAFAKIPPWEILVTHLPVIAIVLLALLAFVGMPGDDLRRWMMVLVVVIAWVIIHVVFFGAARLRLPIHPLLIVAAISGWEMLRGRKLGIGRGRIVLLGAWGLVLVAGWVAEFLRLSSLQ